MRNSILFIFSLLLATGAQGQIILNEASYRNLNQVTDAAGTNPDWIELFNSGNDPVNLGHYHLTDDPADLLKWTMPELKLPAKQWLLVFASGKGISNNEINHWETAVNDDDLWRWINPEESTSGLWMKPEFKDAGWNLDRGGFGYGDGDDRTEFPTDKVSVYTRISFDISDISKIIAATLHIDYDDGFVAYLNGTEVARANMSNIAWNSTADFSHEALLFQRAKPEGFNLDMEKLKVLLHNGPNCLAVEAHNFTAGFIDMSLRTFLSFGLSDSSTQFSPLPVWFFGDADKETHTSFKISNKGETVYLTDNLGRMIDQLTLPADLPVNSSVGSESDGSSTRAVFLEATPNATNETAIAYTEGFEPPPHVSHQGGLYPGTISVTLGSDSPTSEIRYTTSGQDPVAASEQYTGAPIRIAGNSVLKVRCFSTGHKLPGPVATNTYFIDQDLTPAGILSITAENTDLYGESGILDNSWTDWKRQCYIEYFEPGTHRPVFKQHAAIKMDGGAGGSRTQPQQSFRIEPGNSALGDGDVDYPLIPYRSERNNYATFYLRNGSNQYLFYPCKDAIETKCMGDSTKNTFSGYTPVQVYLNGSYWGYYELREKLDEDYFRQHCGTDSDSLEILSVSYFYGGELRAVNGTDPVSRFNADYSRFLTFDPHDGAFWDSADHLFDLEYYTDYICAQSFIADVDWPYNNIRIHRSPQTGNRWRFSLVDLELSLNPNGWTDNTFDHIGFMLGYTRGFPYINIWQVAIQNNRYRDYFINRFADLMNTAWQKGRLTEIANEVYHATRPELPATFKRWGDPNTPVDSYMAQFDQAHQTMLAELSTRAGSVREHLKTNFNLPRAVNITLNVEPVGSGRIRISTVEPQAYPWSGIYFDGVPVRIEALPNPGFVFTQWDNNNLISDPLNAVFLDTLTRAAVFRAHFKSGSFSERIVISEINYNSEASVNAGDWIEVWNQDKTLTASLNGWYFTDDDSSHVFQFPGNTVIRPDERLVIVNDPIRFRLQHPGITFLGSFTFGLGGNGDAVRLFDAKNKLTDAVYYEDSSPWPLGADGQGRTLERANEYHPDGWFDGCIGGSPGRAYSPCADPVVFSEINYNSGSGLDQGDWVELRNVGESAETLSGWVFKDGVDSVGHAFPISDGTLLEPHHNLLLVQDTGKFRTINPGVRNFLGPFDFGLNNKGEWIRAYDSAGKLRLSVRYNDIEPWPVLAGGMGYTLELLDSLGIMDDGINWRIGCIGGSPGKYYSSVCSGSGIQDQTLIGELSVYPNPASDRVHISLSGMVPVRIVLKNLLGETVLFSDENSVDTELSLRHLPAGYYLLSVLPAGGPEKTVRIVKI